MLAERGDDPAVASRTAAELQAEWEAGEAGRLRAVMQVGAVEASTIKVEGLKV